MRPIRQFAQIDVTYTVHTTRDVFDRHNPLLHHVLTEGAGSQRVLAVIDKPVAGSRVGLLDELIHYFRSRPVFQLMAPPVLVPGGERAKRDPKCLEDLYQAIEAAGLGEADTLVAVGGGSLLDLAGYAVGTLGRPPRLLRLPTTAMAQCAWGVSLKSSLHRFGRPDFQGVLSVPLAVINDTAFLQTLPEEAWQMGLASAVRLALLKDAGFLEWIEDRARALARRESDVLPPFVQRSAELEVQRLALLGDPLERQPRKRFDFPEWLLQRLNVPEGNAIALGTALLVSYAYMTGNLSEDEFQRVLELFDRLQLPVYSTAMTRLLEEPDLLERDRPVHLVLPRGMGGCREAEHLDELKLKAGMALLERFQRLHLA